MIIFFIAMMGVLYSRTGFLCAGFTTNGPFKLHSELIKTGKFKESFEIMK